MYQQECKGVQRHNQHYFNIWGYYHLINNKILYICRGTSPIVYFICKSRTNQIEADRQQILQCMYLVSIYGRLFSKMNDSASTLIFFIIIQFAYSLF